MDDAWAVLDALSEQQAVLVGVCTGAGHALTIAVQRPDRVLGVCAINPGLPLTPPHPWKVAHDFDAILATDGGWAKLNRHYWLRDWSGFSEFFFGELFPEPHRRRDRPSTSAWSSAPCW